MTDRWHVDRGVHIYDLVYSLRSHLDRFGFWDVTSTTDVAMSSLSKTTFVLASHPVLLPARITFYSHHHHHSRNMYTHILI
jgi:hypothetical protein